MPRSIPLRPAPLALSLSLFASFSAPALAADPVEQQMVVIGSRAPTSISELPGTVWVIEREQLDQQTQAGVPLKEALGQLIPGLDIGSQGRTNNGQNLRGRSVLVMIDGVSLNSSRGISRQFDSIDPFNIERIEVMSGASAVYGGGATGGIINIVTKKGVGGDTRFNTYMTAPSAASARDAKDCGVDVSFTAPARLAPTRPGEWLEHSPLLIILLVLLAGGWLVHEFSTKPAILAISGLNTYNLLFLMLGALLHWRPRSFLDAVARAVPTTTGVLIQFPLYGSIAAIMTTVNGSDGETLAHHISTFFVQIASHDTYALLMGVYSAVLGFFIPSGGGKWIIEAPYVMQVANELQYHLGWAVQIYNAAEALPNLINPFYMLPLLGVLGLKARDLIGFSFVQLLVHIPLVLVLLWALGSTLAYIPPVMP